MEMTVIVLWQQDKMSKKSENKTSTTAKPKNSSEKHPL